MCPATCFVLIDETLMVISAFPESSLAAYPSCKTHLPSSALDPLGLPVPVGQPLHQTQIPSASVTDLSSHGSPPPPPKAATAARCLSRKNLSRSCHVAPQRFLGFGPPSGVTARVAARPVCVRPRLFTPPRPQLLRHHLLSALVVQPHVR